MGSSKCCGLLFRTRQKPKPNQNYCLSTPQPTSTLYARQGEVRENETTPKKRSLGSGGILSQSHSSSYLTAKSSQQDPDFISCNIWTAAYDELKKDGNLKPLVESYEEFFDTLLWPKALTDNQPVEAEPSFCKFLSPMPRYEDLWSRLTMCYQYIAHIKIRHSSSSNQAETRPGTGRPRAATPMTQQHFRKAAQMFTDITKNQDKTMGIASSALQFIGKIKGVVDGVLASSPPASMAWAGVCLVVLPIVLNHAEQIAAKQVGFNYVMSRFTWYDQVLDLLNRDHWKSQHKFVILRQGIRDEITNLYKLLIEYQLRAYYTYCRPLVTISRDVLKLDDWDGMIISIKEVEKRLQDYMDLNFEQHLLDKLHGLSEDARRRRRKEVTLKFKFPDELPYEVYQAYLDGIDDPEEGTGESVLSHPEFRTWASADSGLFVLSGIPGSGKSVLAKSMLTNLPNWRATTVCSFFFKDNANGQNLATTALCRILDELFGARIALIDDLIPKLEHLLAQQVRCDLDFLWNLLDDATEDTDPGAFTIVLDGLDECDPEDAEDLCTKIKIYLGKPTSRLKFFITTRPLVSIHDPFLSTKAVVLKLNEDPYCLEHLGKDIQQVVASRFEHFAKVCIRDKSLKKQLLALVQPKQERTYLYTKLLFDFLDLKIRDGLPRVPQEWVIVFKTLPATVKEEYLVFLGRVREAHRKDVKLMLQMVVAAARPLTVREINIALNIRDYKRGNPNGLGLQPEESFRDWILDACRFFLDVYNGRVYFIHQTAKDYLLAAKDDPTSVRPEWLGDFTIELCHKTLAESCMAYLLLPFVSASNFKDGKTAPVEPDIAGSGSHLWDMGDLEFSNYASTNYRSHITASRILSPDSGQDRNIMGELSTRLNFPWLFWDAGLVTTVRLQLPPDMVDADLLGRLLSPEDIEFTNVPMHADFRLLDLSKDSDVLVTIHDNTTIVFLNRNRKPMLRIPRIQSSTNSVVESIANVLYSISLFRTISVLPNYQRHSPIPTDWYSVHITATSATETAKRRRTMTIRNVNSSNTFQQEPLLQVRHGDTLSYTLANRTKSVPVHAHMLCLNASWTIGTPVWKEQILPGQEKHGSLAMTIPRKLNTYDKDEIEDEFIVIYVVGEGQNGKAGGDRSGTVEELLKRFYLSPILMGDDAYATHGCCVHVPFIPPPNWQIWRFKVKTVPR